MGGCTYNREQYGPHLEFVETKDTGKTKVWNVRSSHAPKPKLGEIRWYWAWRRYAFFPEPNTLFDVRCMSMISKFISDQMDERKKKREK